MILSCIISTYGKEAAVLEATLKRLLPFPFDAVEIIVVDQNPDRRMEAVCGRLQSVFPPLALSYVASGERGLSRGRNVGIKHAHGAWLYFCDDDVEFHPADWGAFLSYLSERGDRALMLYGQLFQSGTTKPYLRRAAHTPRLSYWNFDGMSSVGLLFSKKAIERIGFFDERFGVGSIYGAGEEADMILRAIGHSIPVEYWPAFQVSHPASTPDFSRASSYGTGLGALYHKHLHDSFGAWFALTCKYIFEISFRAALIVYYRVVGKEAWATFHATYILAFWQHLWKPLQ